LGLEQDVISRTEGNTPDRVSGGGMSRVYEVAAGTTVAFRNLTVIDGNGLANNPDGTSARDGSGGGVLNLGTLVVSDCTLSGNTVLTQNGGGLLNYYGTLFVVDSTFSGNYAA